MKKAFSIAFAIRLGLDFGTFVVNVGYGVLRRIFDMVDESKHSVADESGTKA